LNPSPTTVDELTTQDTRRPPRLLDAHNLVRDSRDAGLGGGHDTVTVLVRLLVGQDRAHVGGSSELFDGGHCFGHV
jgi:hypothetical protein